MTALLYRNNDPLRLLAPDRAAVSGVYITLIPTTVGTSGTTFLGQPQGSTVTDTARFRGLSTDPGHVCLKRVFFLMQQSQIVPLE